MVLFKLIKKLFVTINPKKTCKLEFVDHLWLPFLDQSQSVVFEIIYFHMYIILVTECKLIMCPNDIIIFNE